MDPATFASHLRALLDDFPAPTLRAIRELQELALRGDLRRPREKPAHELVDAGQRLRGCVGAIGVPAAIAAIAAARGQDPLSTMYDLMLESDAGAMLMFASDFPHNHAPASPAAFLAPLPAEAARKIMRDNAAAFYRLPVS